MRRQTLLRGLISLAALAGVVWWASRQQAPSLPSSSSALVLLCVALALYGGVTLVRGERWLRILRHGRIAANRPEAYGLTTVGYMGNNLLPARAGEAIRTVLMARRSGASKRAVLGTIIAERVLDAAVLGIMLLAVVYLLLRETALPIEPSAALLGALAAALAAALLVALAARRGALARTLEFVRPLGSASRALLSRHGALVLALALAVWVLETGVYLAAAGAVDLGLGLGELLYLTALTNVAGALPAAPGQLGTFDAALLFGAGALGIAGSVAIGYLLVLRFVLFVPVTVTGAIVLVAGYGGRRCAREPHPAVAPGEAVSALAHRGT